MKRHVATLAISDHMRLNRRRYADQTAIVDDERSVTYAELIDRAWAVAHGLSRTGVRAGATVGVLAGNRIFLAEAYLGVLAAGAVPVLYNWRWAPPELAFALGDSRAECVFVDREFGGLLADATEIHGSVRAIQEGAEFEAFLGQPVEPSHRAAGDAPNVIIYTGGTTGFPKGVVLSNDAVAANCISEIVDTGIEAGDCTLIIAPLFHAAALCCWFLPHFLLGARSVLMRQFDEERFAQVTVEQRVTNGYLAPNMVRRLLAAGTLGPVANSEYRRMYVGGAAFQMADKIAVRSALPEVQIFYQYGLSEASGIVTRLLPQDMYRSDIDGSIGREFLLWETSVRDPDSGAEVEVNAVGELWLRGPGMMSGYYHRPEDTAAVLQDGWLRTGDLVSRDREGYLFHHDRIKDMIKSGGENVYSAEVERVLQAHPAISEVAVIGVPSEEWDEQVCAVICVADGQTVTESDIRGFCRSRLAGYKVPKQVSFLPRELLPVNDSGKIVKSALRDMDLFSSRSRAAAEPPSVGAKPADLV